MSDFDREAERERLREQFERDREKREQSERMSDLLLKGATMTNVHCEECGDPIFRHEGQEFCPTCRREVVIDEDGSLVDDATGGAEAADATDAPDRPAGDESGAPPAGRDATDPDAAGATGERPAGSAAADSGAANATAGGRRPAGSDWGAGGTAGAGASRPRSTGDDEADAPEDGIAGARAALVRTLADAARRAEATSDPRTRRDHLAAAREAAETLAALR